MRPLCALGLIGLLVAGDAFASDKVLVVVGAPGEVEYGEQFAEWARDWQQAAKLADVRIETIGADEKDRELLQQTLTKEDKNGDETLWLVLIGHGTFDGAEAKFNLRGSDVSGRELKMWLAPFKRPLVIVDLSAASGPFLAELAGPRRVIITATRSGSERNFARFGGDFSKAITSPAADLNKDGQTSLLEAFISATNSVKAFYEGEQRIVTEHALLEDSGDGLGTPADAFERLEAKYLEKNSPPADGAVAREIVLVKNSLKLSPELEAKCKQLEAAIARLRQTKGKMPESEYYHRLETLLLDLARIDLPGDKRP